MELKYITIAIFLLADYAWIWIHTNTDWGIYKNVIKQAKLDDVGWFARAVCILLAYAPLPLFLFLMPLATMSKAAIFGASLGGAVYVIYNTTAYILFPPWREKRGWFPIAAIDTLWGVALYTGVSVACNWLDEF